MSKHMAYCQAKHLMVCKMANAWDGIWDMRRRAATMRTLKVA